MTLQAPCVNVSMLALRSRTPCSGHRLSGCRGWLFDLAADFCAFSSPAPGNVEGGSNNDSDAHWPYFKTVRLLTCLVSPAVPANAFSNVTPMLHANTHGRVLILFTYIKGREWSKKRKLQDTENQRNKRSKESCRSQLLFILSSWHAKHMTFRYDQTLTELALSLVCLFFSAIFPFQEPIKLSLFFSECKGCGWMQDH